MRCCIDISANVSAGKGLILVPCYNEAESIQQVLLKIKSVVDLPIVVIDDGSKDNSVAACGDLCTVLRLPTNLGIGGAMQTGFKYAVKQGFSYAIQIDGDGQHPPAELVKILQEFQKTQADLVIGSRFLRTGGFRSTFARRMGIGLISQALLILFGVHITDPTSGFRLYSQNALLRLSHDYPQDFPEPISIATVIQQGMRVTETPVVMEERKHGQSSISAGASFFYMLKVLLGLIVLKF